VLIGNTDSIPGNVSIASDAQLIFDQTEADGDPLNARNAASQRRRRARRAFSRQARRRRRPLSNNAGSTQVGRASQGHDAESPGPHRARGRRPRVLAARTAAAGPWKERSSRRERRGEADDRPAALRPGRRQHRGQGDLVVACRPGRRREHPCGRPRRAKRRDLASGASPAPAAGGGPASRRRRVRRAHRRHALRPAQSSGE
jgi:hypothetical protein